MGKWERGNTVKEARRKMEKHEMCKFFFFLRNIVQSYTFE